MQEPKYVVSIIACVVALLSTNVLAQDAAAPTTRSDCTDQFNQCMSDSNGFFGLFVCAGPYGQCISQVQATLPPEINDAVSKVSVCQDMASACRKEAGNDSTQLQACVKAQSQCVMSALHIDLTVPKGVSACFGTLQECVQGASKVSDIPACAQDLQTCLARPDTSKPN